MSVRAVRDPASGPAARWNPRIVVFACNWCSYAGADTAGVSRIQHQPYFRMIRVMCSGRIEPSFVLRAFEKGADGVLVSGCHFGDCHYVFGNHRAAEQFEKTRRVVRLLGLEGGRLRLEWISAAEGARFAQVIDEFTDAVRSLGPSPLTPMADQAVPDAMGPDELAAEAESGGTMPAAPGLVGGAPEATTAGTGQGTELGTGGGTPARRRRGKS